MSSDIKIDEIEWDKQVDAPIMAEEVSWDEPKQKSTPAPPAPSLKNHSQKKEKSFWDSAKKAASEAWHMIAPGVDNVVNTLLPIGEVEISDSPDTLRHKMDDSPTLSTYKKVGELANLGASLTKNPTKEDIDNYNKNLGHLLVDKLGYDDFGIDEFGKYYVSKEGKDYPLETDSLKASLGSLLGDSGEIVGGMAGAKKGYDAGKALGWKGKLLGSVAGGAIGAAGGNVFDQIVSSIETGEKLTMAQRVNELNKAALMDIAGNVGGAAAAKVISGAGKGISGIAKLKNYPDKIKEEAINSLSKVPDREREKLIDALDYAQEMGLKLANSSVAKNRYIDQYTQVLARNPAIAERIKTGEAKNQDALVNRIFEILDETSGKADGEEIGALLKQELGEAKNIRRAETDKAYDDFREKISGDIVSTGKSLKEDIIKIGQKYGGEIEGDILDEDVKKHTFKINKLIDNLASRGKLDAKNLDKINSMLYKQAQSNDPIKNAVYNNARDRVSAEIEALAEKEGDEITKSLRRAKQLYKDKENIYGISSKHKDIKNALESDEPNSAVERLLSGTNALDNAKILKQELSRTKHGRELINALGRKHIDDLMEKVDMTSPKAMQQVLDSDKMKVAKSLLGEKKSKELETINNLFGMMARTEKLLAGAQSEMATATNADLKTQAYHGLKKFMVRLQQNRLIGKLVADNYAQRLLHKTLKSAQSVHSPATAKSLSNNIKHTAKVISKKYDIDMNDIINKTDQRAVKEIQRVNATKEPEEGSVNAFTTPHSYEIQAMEKLVEGDDKYRSFSQVLRRIQDGSATTMDKKHYIQKKRKLGETLEKEVNSIKENEKKELDFLKENIDTLDDAGLKRLKHLDEKFNGKLFGAVGAGIALGASQSDAKADDASAYIGKKEINMKNNAILKDGKLTRDELVTLIEHAPDFEKQLSTFGDIKSEGKEKVMNRMLSMFNDEDPVTALAMVAENFYNGDDKKFMQAIQDKKIENISDTWVKSMISQNSKADTPVSDDYFKDIMKGVFESEGGYVNDPDDMGGETKYGISKRSYPNEDIKNLSKERAMELYHDKWIEKGYNKIKNKKVAAQLFDMGINAGDSRAIKKAQRLLGVKADGILGPNTIKAINDAGDDFLKEYKEARASYYRDISRYGNNKKYLKGWLKRIERV